MGQDERERIKRKERRQNSGPKSGPDVVPLQKTTRPMRLGRHIVQMSTRSWSLFQVLGHQTAPGQNSSVVTEKCKIDRKKSLHANVLRTRSIHVAEIDAALLYTFHHGPH